MTQQIGDIKEIKPNWSNETDLPVGIIVVRGYYHNKKEPVEASEDRLYEEVFKLLDKRKKLQLFSATWKNIPHEKESEYINSWVSILFLTNKMK